MHNLFIIHAGAPKTGTASLANFLYNNNNILLNLNIYLPKTTQLFGKHRLNKLSIPDILSSFKFEIKQNEDKNILMLDENFSSLNRLGVQIIKIIKDTLPNHKIKIVYYVPRIDYFLKRMYYQALEDCYLENNTLYEDYCLSFYKKLSCFLLRF